MKDQIKSVSKEFQQFVNDTDGKISPEHAVGLGLASMMGLLGFGFVGKFVSSMDDFTHLVAQPPTPELLLQEQKAFFRAFGSLFASILSLSAAGIFIDNISRDIGPQPTNAKN